MVRLDRLAVACLAVAFVGACADDSTRADQAPEDGDGAGGTDTAEPHQEDETGTAPGSGNPDDGGTDSQGAADGSDDDGDNGDFACAADCGPAGKCVLSEDGLESCACDVGYTPFGMQCLVCKETSGFTELAIEPVDVAVRVLINGEPAPASNYENAAIWLQDRASGDRVRLGETKDGSRLAASVLPGTYDVMYERLLGGNVVPRNEAAIVGRLDVWDSTEMEIDLQAVDVRGAITLAGAEPPQGNYENGKIVFVDPRTGDEIHVGNTNNGSYAATVLPGKYDVHYQLLLGGDDVPSNRDAFITTVEVKADDSTRAQIDIDVPVIEISGPITLDGASPPQSNYETAALVLVDLTTGDEVLLGETQHGEFSRRVVPGVYDLVYQRILGGDVVPINRRAVLGTVDVVSEPNFTVAIETATIAGDFTLDDGPMTAAPGEDATVSLLDPKTGDEILLGNLSTGSFNRKVLPGSYDVVYSQLSAAGALPANTGAILQSLDVAPGDSRVPAIDIGTAVVTGSILLDGLEPPTSEFSDGRLYLRNQSSGDSVLLGSTRAGEFAATVVPGTYDVVYVVETAGEEVPVNNRATVLSSIDVTDGAELALDIPVFEVLGRLLVNGTRAPSDTGNRGQLLLEDVATGDIIPLGGTNAGDFSRNVTAGRYVVVYEGQASTGIMPANEHAGLACLDLVVR
ncbi:MAG: hypothetical protein JKY37_20510 [Nannocystaceae bacterium]|nr:hypothetical protein [Nannocystaceae bacterium]